jgi:hypothetical protein
MRGYVITFFTGNAAALLFSAAARALPEPEPLGSRFYLWFYRFSQQLLANFDLSGTPGKPK